jgi:hypothetical protein
MSTMERGSPFVMFRMHPDVRRDALLFSEPDHVQLTRGPKGTQFAWGRFFWCLIRLS